ncbi:MAG TPA: PEGA domain-containing protein [Kofleriaceae bacterium]
MPTGVPIYLVSACASGEEFVAAFRRYADKTGLFVPIAEPLAAGQKLRLALTLADGGVMVEGDAEVISAARAPSILHGRVGMTVKFTVPDDASRTVLTELEKARLAMKPQPPSVPPRPAAVPASPRPVPPAPAGRIDAINALAECVAIGGDASARIPADAPGRSSPTTSPPPLKPGPRFVVPTIPPGRTRPPTGAPPPALEDGATLATPPLLRPTGEQAAIAPDTLTAGPPPLAASPGASPLAASPGASPLAASPGPSPLAASPGPSPLAASPAPAPLAASPGPSPLAASPAPSPLAASPARTPTTTAAPLARTPTISGAQPTTGAPPTTGAQPTTARTPTISGAQPPLARPPTTTAARPPTGAQPPTTTAAQPPTTTAAQPPTTTAAQPPLARTPTTTAAQPLAHTPTTIGAPPLARTPTISGAQPTTTAAQPPLARPPTTTGAQPPLARTQTTIGAPPLARTQTISGAQPPIAKPAEAMPAEAMPADDGATIAMPPLARPDAITGEQPPLPFASAVAQPPLARTSTLSGVQSPIAKSGAQPPLGAAPPVAPPVAAPPVAPPVGTPPVAAPRPSPAAVSVAPPVAAPPVSAPPVAAPPVAALPLAAPPAPPEDLEPAHRQSDPRQGTSPLPIITRRPAPPSTPPPPGAPQNPYKTAPARGMSETLVAVPQIDDDIAASLAGPPPSSATATMTAVVPIDLDDGSLDGASDPTIEPPAPAQPPIGVPRERVVSTTITAVTPPIIERDPPTPRPHGTGAPPLARTTPAGPVPIAVVRGSQPSPKFSAPVSLEDLDLSEATDLTDMPIADAGSSGRIARESRRTVLGVAVVPLSSPPVTPAASGGFAATFGTASFSTPTADMPASVDPTAQTLPPPPNVEEPTPSGDWTMTPGASGPTIVPTPRRKAKGEPTDDWTIALDPSAPDGWTAPSKVEKLPPQPQQPGPPVSAVSGERSLGVAADAPAADAGPKIEIDPSLSMPDGAAASDTHTLTPSSDLRPPAAALAAFAAADHPSATMQHAAPPPNAVATTTLTGAPSFFPQTLPPSAGMFGGPGTYPVYSASEVLDAAPAAAADGALQPGAVPIVPMPMPPPPAPLPAATGNAFSLEVPMAYAAPARPPTDAGASVDFAPYTGATATVRPARSSKTLLLIGGIVVAAAVGIVAIVLALGHRSSKPEHGPAPAPSTAAPVPSIAPAPSAPTPAPPPGPTAETPPAPTPTPVVAPPPADCFVDVVTLPAGAEVVTDKGEVLGTSPRHITLPCGAKIELTLRKAHFVSVSRTVTPTPTGAKIRAALGKPTFSVKVTSSPMGATITANGKSLGVTPATVKLTAFETTTITLSRDGFVPDKETLTPRTNGVLIHANLVRATRHH